MGYLYHKKIVHREKISLSNDKARRFFHLFPNQINSLLNERNAMRKSFSKYGLAPMLFLFHDEK